MWQNKSCHLFDRLVDQSSHLKITLKKNQSNESAGLEEESDKNLEETFYINFFLKKFYDIKLAGDLK